MAQPLQRDETVTEPVFMGRDEVSGGIFSVVDRLRWLRQGFENVCKMEHPVNCVPEELVQELDILGRVSLELENVAKRLSGAEQDTQGVSGQPDRARLPKWLQG